MKPTEYVQFTNLFTIFTPPENYNISTHAEAFRYLPKESSFDSGKWSNLKYQELIQNSITEPDVEEVVIMCSAQSGKSEMLVNICFYYSDIEVSPILMVQPNFTLCNAFSKDRLSPSIRDSERMSNIFGSQSGQGDSTILRKQGNNGAIVSFGSFNALSSLASKSIRILLADEIDRIEKIDSAEGNVLKIMDERTSAFPNRKIVKVSTPKKVQFSHIYRSYLLSDQGLLQAKCSHCNDYFDLVWETVNWEMSETGLVEGSECIVCSTCGGIHTNSDRTQLIKDVRFRIRNPKSKIRGFNFNVLATVNHTLTELIQEYLEAKDDPTAMEAFVTLKMGLPFEEMYTHKSATDYDHRLSDYTHDNIPDDILYITCGIDVQKDRFETNVWAFGETGQMYHLDYIVTPANCTLKEEWVSLYNVLSQLSYTLESGVKIKPATFGIDSGYQTKTCYQFCETARASSAQLKIFPVKGGGNSLTPITPLNNRRQKGVKHYNLGTFQLKELVYNRLNIEEKENSGFVNFSKNYINDDFFKQLHNERKNISSKNGKLVERYDVIDDKVRNEILDCMCYAIAAFSIDKPNMKYLSKARKINIKNFNKGIE